MSGSQEQDHSARNLPPHAPLPAGRHGESAAQKEEPKNEEHNGTGGRLLAVLLDTVATADRDFLPTFFKIVDHSPAWSSHLWALLEAVKDCEEPEGPERYVRTWGWLQDLEKLLAHPDQHPAKVVVCHQPLPLLRLCTARLERRAAPEDSADPEGSAALQTVYRSLNRLVAVKMRAARRRQRRTAAALQPAAVLEEVHDEMG